MCEGYSMGMSRGDMSSTLKTVPVKVRHEMYVQYS